VSDYDPGNLSTDVDDDGHWSAVEPDRSAHLGGHGIEAVIRSPPVRPVPRPCDQHASDAPEAALGIRHFTAGRNLRNETRTGTSLTTTVTAALQDLGSTLAAEGAPRLPGRAKRITQGSRGRMAMSTVRSWPWLSGKAGGVSEGRDEMATTSSRAEPRRPADRAGRWRCRRTPWPAA
jgi:hypothetical protein